MSVDAFTPPPLDFPDVEGVDVPGGFWEALVDSVPTDWAFLPLDTRHRIDTESLALGEAILLGKGRGYWGAHVLAHHYGPDTALQLCYRDAQHARWELIREAREDREQAIRVLPRVHCGARRASGTMCRAMAEPGRNRCRFHGGASTGPTTDAGRARSLANLRQYAGA